LPPDGFASCRGRRRPTIDRCRRSRDVAGCSAILSIGMGRPLVLLILVLVAIALADVSFDVAEMLGWFTG